MVSSLPLTIAIATMVAVVIVVAVSVVVVVVAALVVLVVDVVVLGSCPGDLPRPTKYGRYVITNTC